MRKITMFCLLSVVLFSCNPSPSDSKLNQQTEVQLDTIDEGLTKNDKSNELITVGSFNFLPSSTTGAVYERSTYSFSYHEGYEQAEWVAYELTSNDTKYRKYERPLFNQDPLVKTKSADWRNYKNVPYNKGHLLPASDRRKSYKEYKETFYTSNISPQNPEFNAGIWNRLEQKVRYWATKYNGLYVVTGGVLEPNLKTIGNEKVGVPNYFYKVLMTKDKSKMIGFLVPHKDSDQPLYNFVTSVDKIEELTGIDFFKSLPDDIEEILEKNTSYKDWSFN